MDIITLLLIAIAILKGIEYLFGIEIYIQGTRLVIEYGKETKP